MFNVGDEFLIHVFKSHFTASILPILNVQSSSETTVYQPTQQWLRSTAEQIVNNVLLPVVSSDPVHNFHKCFLHHMFMYIDLREAIRWESLEQPSILVNTLSTSNPSVSGRPLTLPPCQSAERDGRRVG